MTFNTIFRQLRQIVDKFKFSSARNDTFKVEYLLNIINSRESCCLEHSFWDYKTYSNLELERSFRDHPTESMSFQKRSTGNQSRKMGFSNVSGKDTAQTSGVLFNPCCFSREQIVNGKDDMITVCSIKNSNDTTHDP